MERRARPWLFAAIEHAQGVLALAFDGPGQGEAEYNFPIRYDYENVLAPVIDWVKANFRDVDSDRIGIWGISLGGYYAPRTVAFEKRIRAAVANCGPYNWGALWEKLPELTRLAYAQPQQDRCGSKGEVVHAVDGGRGGARSNVRCW